MQNKRDIEILVGVLLVMSTATSIVALMLYYLFAMNVVVGAGTLMSAYLLRSAALVPRFISALGITGSVMILFRVVLIMFHIIEPMSLPGVLLSLPTFGFNISLAARLLWRGFNESQPPQQLKQNLFKLSKKQ